MIILNSTFITTSLCYANFYDKKNVFVSGEMLDWEAPTGGYLLQACLANGAFVANNIIKNIL